ncbi:calcium-binding protein, partial [Phenylobacterium sp.]|uniref:calcium-binding protein n=1 Tax=Phenylobacterium sp. TaxID=1871053 RepID=UPI002FE0EC2A
DLQGGAGADTLKGGAGDDTLTGGADADTLVGGAGADTAVFSGARADYAVTLNGDGSITVTDNRQAGDGVDTLTGVEFLKFSDQTIAAPVQGNVITGTDSHDTLAGTAGADTIAGGGGVDILSGLEGDDSVSGGQGHDVLRGHTGADTLHGDADDDQLVGGAGDDVLDGGSGIDRASFSSDATEGVRVDLRISGPQDTGQGVDTLIGIENLSGTRFSDTLTGTSGDNWLWGGSDGSGVTGNDVIDGDAGNDLVQVGPGDHTLKGGAGLDTLSFNGNGTDISPDGVAVSLALQGAAQATRQGAMTLDGFENLSGSAYGDTLAGDGGANQLLGFAGSDSLSGGAGNDILRGDAVMRPDTHGVGGSGPIGVVIDGDGADTLDGGEGDDVIAAAGGDDDLRGGDGSDSLYSGAGADKVDGGAGSDTFFLSGARADYEITVGEGGSLVIADLRPGAPEGTDTVSGVEFFAFSDGVRAHDALDGQTQQGTPGNDTFDGGAGADTLDGLGGDDRLTGHGGSDRLDGGPGHDIAGFPLPQDTVGSLRSVAGVGADAGKIIVQVVDGNTVTDVFRVTVTDGDAVVEGLGPLAGLGTDTVTDVEELHFFIPSDTPTPGHFVGLNLTVNVGQVSGGFAFVNGSADGDTIDLAALYPDSDSVEIG